jgi:hypothetical protein
MVNISCTTQGVERQGRKHGKDVVVVGSSPVLLIEAAALAAEGFNVTVVEKSNVLGGAWKMIPSFGLMVEIGSHLFYPNRKAFKFLKKKLNVPVFMLDPQPSFYSRQSGRFFPDNGASYALDKLINWKRNGLTLVSAAILFAKIFYHLAKSWIVGGCFYVENGTSNLINILKDILIKNGGEILIGTECHSVVVGASEGVTVVTDCGERQVDQVVMSSGSTVDFSSPKDVLERGDLNFRNTYHCYMLIDRKPKDWTFISFGIPTFAFAGSRAKSKTEDGFIVRISEMDNYVVGDRQELSVICASIIREHPEISDRKDEELPALILSEIEKIGLLQPGTKLIDGNVGQYHWFVTRDALRRVVNGYEDRVRVLDCANFSAAIAMNADRWSNMFNGKIS